MNLEAEPAAEPQVTARWRHWLARGRGRWLGILVGVLYAAAMLADPAPLPQVRLSAFDAYQVWLPRETRSEAAIIIAVDDDSLSRIGQWPWPRHVIARLLDRIAEQRPAAIALDILFSEPDRSSPEHIAQSLHTPDPVVASRLAKLRPNDVLLAESIARNRAVVGVAAIDEPSAQAAVSTPISIVGPPPPLLRFRGALRSLPQLDQAASGHGLLNAEPESGIVRRVPLVAYVGGNPMLTLGLESMRVAQNLPGATLRFEADTTHILLGEVHVQAQADGQAWVHYTRHDPTRFVSAADVLEGRNDRALIEGKIALVGATAVTMEDKPTTPLGERMAGIEIHAQVIENILGENLLLRPVWAQGAETLAYALAGALLIFAVPRVRPRNSLLIFFTCWLVIAAGSLAAYLWGHMLFDLIAPILGLMIVYAIMLSATLVVSDLSRRELATRLAAQREAAARVTGELEAARRIQMGILPTRESALVHERRVEIFAYMKAAREVGGDLYDFFSLPGDKFFVMEGDVSGKGLPAAMFMAVSKAVAKSCALRLGDGAAAMVRAFNSEISRENPEQMFVTMVVLVIDLKTGEVEYCNAGHEPPLLVRRSGEAVVLDDAGGPPLCVADDYPYEQAHARLEPRDVLALASDGLTEAMNRDKALYGRARLKALLESPERRGVDLTVLGNEILAGVKRFEGTAEPTDDQTLVLVSWRH